MSTAPEPSRETIVMKFGGSSVADPDKIRHVAERLVEARGRGVRVVATVSAMGDTTDGLLELARQVSPEPHPRELDMLLSTGERIACALVAMAVHDLGYEAVSFTGSQAGIITDPVHTKAKIREITPGRVRRGARPRADRPRRRLPGLLARHDGRDHARPWRHRCHGGRARRRARCVLRDLLRRRRACSPRDPRIVPDARKLERVSYEEMLEMSAAGAKVLMLRAVEIARNQDVPVHARSTFSDEPGTWVRAPKGSSRRSSRP